MSPKARLALFGSVLLAGCLGQIPQPPPVVEYHHYGDDLRRAGETHRRDYASPNPLRGLARARRLDMTPAGYTCKPDQPWEVSLTGHRGTVCVQLTTVEMVYGEPEPVAPPIAARLRVDGTSSDPFELEPISVPQRFSRCTSTRGGAANQWIYHFQACFRSAVITAESRCAELFLPEVAGDQPFVIWRFVD